MRKTLRLLPALALTAGFLAVGFAAPPAVASTTVTPVPWTNSTDTITSYGASQALGAPHPNTSATTPATNDLVTPFFAGTDATVTIPADTTGVPVGYQGNTSNQMYRMMQATLAPVAPACSGGGGLATVTASMTIRNNGPANGQDFVGGFRLNNGTSQVGGGNLWNDFAANAEGTFTATAMVPADDVAAGNVRLNIAVETYHAGSKSWTFSNFSSSYVLRCPPVPHDDAPVEIGAGPYTVDLLANDDQDATAAPAALDPASVQLWNPTTSTWGTSLTTADGTYTVDTTTGQVTFAPTDPNFSGEVTEPVRYRVSNTDMTSAMRTSSPDNAYGESTLTITVATAVADDEAITPPGQPVTIDVLDNDGIADVDPSTLQLVDTSGDLTVGPLSVTEGVWTIEDGAVVFTPAAGYSGPVPPARYVVEDGDGKPYTAEVAVTVTEPAVDDVVTVVPGVPVSVDVLANDGIAGVDAGTLSLVDPATGGLVSSLAVDGGVWSVVDGGIVFTPDDDVSTTPPGPVAYVVEDADGNPYSAVVTPTVAEPAVDDSAVVVPGVPVTVDVLANDGVADADPGTLSLVDPATGGLVTTLAVDGGVWTVVDGEVVFTPDGDVLTTPPSPVDYVVFGSDGTPYTAVVTLAVAVPAVDDSAVVVPGTPVTVDVLANDGITDVDPDTLSLLDPSTGGLVSTLTVDGGVWSVVDGEVVFTPDDGVSTTPPGPVTYVVEDADGNAFSAVVTLSVADPAVDDAVTVVPGQTVVVDVLANDGITGADADTLALVDPATGGLVTSLAVDGGVWSVVDGKVVFTPDDDVSTTPPSPVTYVVEDADGNPYSAVVTPSVAGPAVDDSAVVVPGQTVTVDVLANDGIADADPGTLALVDPSTGGLVTSLTVDGGVWSVVDGKVVFTPDGDVSTTPPGPVTYVVEDADGNPYSAEVTVTVADPAVDDSAVVVPGVPVTVDVLANDGITGADPGTLALVDPATGGLVTTLAVDGGVWSVVDGEVVFTPDDGVSTTPPGPVTYVVEDADGNAYSAVVALSVAEPAVDDAVTVVPGQTVVVDVLANDGIAGADAGTLRLVDPATGELVTSLTVDGGVWTVVDGKVVFTPDDDVSTSPPGPVAYVVEDADGNPYSAEVTVTVAVPAVDDTVAGTEGSGPLVVDPLANDGDPDLDPTSVRLVDPATGLPVTRVEFPEGVWTVD
ncbi:MAG: hypothetical protein QM621_14415, partial [Aeromicrobium sp.]|uniref:beta strand repeat-containing protein n=1 Tax=Aeromicrobium sp. TaxID=1871063 RepID=UPI0039E38D09